MEGAMEDLQDTFIVHTIEEIQVSTARTGINKGASLCFKADSVAVVVGWF